MAFLVRPKESSALVLGCTNLIYLDIVNTQDYSSGRCALQTADFLQVAFCLCLKLWGTL
jgi:hypothetical protein